MKCSEFRERCGAEPRRRDEALAAHEAECSACAGHAESVRALDDLIGDALNVPVPPPRRAAASRGALSRPQLAMAAGLAIVAVTGVLLLYVAAFGDSDRALARNVAAHLEGEATTVAAMRSSADLDAVRSVLSRFNARVAEDIGPVLDARICIVGGKEVVHLVVERDTGPVTVMLIPERELARPMPIDTVTVAGPLIGRILTRGAGTIAIVSHGQPVERVVEEQLVASIAWEEV